MTEEASTKPSTQPQNDTSANVVRDTPFPIDAKTKADTENSNSEGDTEILNVDEEQAPATKSILDKLLQEFQDEILNVTMVDDEADFNPTKDLEELERLLAKEPQSNFTEIQIRTLYILEGDDEVACDGGGLLEEENLEHCFEHVVSSSYRAKPGE
ncbi:hypothetical protein Tco_0767069 [Tanacetum coccineum]